MWLIAVAAMVVACSEDEGTPVTPSFPEEEQILSVKAGESVEIVLMLQWIGNCILQLCGVDSLME